MKKIALLLIIFGLFSGCSLKKTPAETGRQVQECHDNGLKARGDQFAVVCYHDE